MSISTTIKSIQTIMRKDKGVDGDAQRLSQLVWMLFLKIFDDREIQWELLQDDYKSALPEQYRWRNWASNPEGLTGDALKHFIDNEMFPALKNLEAKTNDQRAYVVRSVFEDAYNYMKSGQLLRQVINKIQEGVDFNIAQERHLFGDIYEQLLRDLQAAGNAGEFYTPRAVTEFMVRMVNPRLGEKVMDPACGTGGFLTSTIEHIRKQDVKTVEDESILQASIHGVEKKPMPHLLCTTNMILHGIDVPINIKYDNTLAKPLISWSPSERVDVIITNPPFGGNEEDGIETNFPAAFRTKETADLFLVLIIQLLKEGGRAALVLPDGFLSGDGIKARIKEKLLEDCNLHTIVRLPSSVFAPYTNIKTNLLFFTKGSPTKDVWFYEQQLPTGIKAYNKTKPMKLNDLNSLANWWGKSEENYKSREENSHAWKVSLDEIKSHNYNLDCKNPHIIDKEIHDPESLLSQYAEIQKDMNLLRNNLKHILSDAFKASNPKDAEEFKDSWQRIANHFDILFTTEVSIDQLKQTLLQAAVMGKLVPQDPNDESVYELLKGIQSKLISKEKIPFKLPISWAYLKLKDSYQSISSSGKQLKTSEIKTNGKFPVIDQGKSFIAGYTDDDKCLIKIVHPVIVFGDHTRNIKFIDFNFVPGADGTKILAPKLLNPKFFYYYLLSYKLESKGYARHFKILNDNFIAIPPLDEQYRIVSKLEELMSLCDELKYRIQQASTKQKQVVDVLVSQALH
jgi:type I restriction enzyme M protein